MLRATLGFAVLIVALSVSYYFAIALPRHNRDVLDFEKLKYKAQQDKEAEREKALKEDQAIKATLLDSCIETANENFNADLKRNGTLTSTGRYALNLELSKSIERRQETAIGECHKQFGK